MAEASTKSDSAFEEAERRVAAAIGDDYLDLSIPYLATIPSLAALASLRSLDLVGTQVSDLAPLANLTALQLLNLRNSQVGDLTPLANLRTMQSLNLTSAPVSDLAPLANLTTLQSLDLRRTRVSNLVPLADLAALEDLILWDTPVSNISPLAGLTALQSLDLMGTQVSDLAPLANLTALQSLDLRRIRVADLAPLANLTALSSLYLAETQVSDLAPLANLAVLLALNLASTSVSDLAPLANLAALSSLYLAETQVSDLAPLANLSALELLDLAGARISDLTALSNLTALRTLHLTRTPVSDLAPLANLAALSSLYLAETQVSDLAPLANLSALELLDLTGTRVSHLTALSNLTALSDGAVRHKFLGLMISGVTLEDSRLNELGRTENPDRTIDIINYLREQQGLPPYFPDSRKEPQLPASPPQPLPEPQPGPHFALRSDGVVDFAPPASLDASGNDLELLRGLQPQLRSLAHALSQALSAGNAPHSHIATVTADYAAEIDKELAQIDFWKLTGWGIQLEKAADAAERKITDRDLPELGDPEKARLDSLIELNGPFVMATVPGRKIVALATQYQGSPAAKEAQRHETAFAENLRKHPEIAAPPAANFVADSVKTAGDGNAKAKVYGEGASFNAVLVITAAASVFVLPTVAGALMGGTVGSLVGALIGRIGFKIMEKTAPVDGALSAGAKAIEAMPRAIFRKYLDFVLANEQSLRGMAGTRRSMRWLAAHLDWLKANAPKD